MIINAKNYKCVLHGDVCGHPFVNFESDVIKIAD